MVGTKKAAEATLRLTRTFAAPRERVFRAWTEPEELKRWWGPEGYATASAEVDLRVGASTGSGCASCRMAWSST